MEKDMARNRHKDSEKDKDRHRDLGRGCDRDRDSERDEDERLSDRGWPQSVRLSDSMWDMACRYLLGSLSRAEYRQELLALGVYYPVAAGGDMGPALRLVGHAGGC